MTTSSPVVDLTRRERDVLALMALGHSNSGICAELQISPKTLETHVQHVFWKLGLLPMNECHRRVCAVLAWIGAPSVNDVTPVSGDTLMYAR